MVFCGETMCVYVDVGSVRLEKIVGPRSLEASYPRKVTHLLLQLTIENQSTKQVKFVCK